MCPLFNCINKEDEVAGDLSPKTIAVLVDEFTEIKNQMSDLRKQEESLKELFLRYVNEKDPNDEQKYFRLGGTKEDVKISKDKKFSIKDKEAFIFKIKEI